MPCWTGGVLQPLSKHACCARVFVCQLRAMLKCWVFGEWATCGATCSGTATGLSCAVTRKLVALFVQAQQHCKGHASTYTQLCSAHALRTWLRVAFNAKVAFPESRLQASVRQQLQESELL